MFSGRRLLSLGALALLILAAGCGEPAKPAAAPKSIDDRFPIKVGDRIVQMRVALTPGEQQRGLMFVSAMGPDDGMLFVFARPQVMTFWMRNTELPLDIGFLDPDGTLREFYPMFPHDEKPVISAGRHQLALELNQGWFSRTGVKPGARLDLPALREAIRARGFKPDDYDLR